jgi:hypothetical protein
MSQNKSERQHGLRGRVAAGPAGFGGPECGGHPAFLFKGRLYCAVELLLWQATQRSGTLFRPAGLPHQDME